jgi:hypothetical protein
MELWQSQQKGSQTMTVTKLARAIENLVRCSITWDRLKNAQAEAALHNARTDLDQALFERDQAKRP